MTLYVGTLNQLDKERNHMKFSNFLNFEAKGYKGKIFLF